MFFIYNILIHTASFFVKIAALFSAKMRLFVNGRKEIWEHLYNDLSSNSKVIWFHAASLGEYEQGLPVMEAVKKQYPGYIILLTFFSPSGYEVRKNNTVADLTLYLPMDTAANARRFITILKPEMVFFIKYEYWPNVLRVLQKNKIRTFLISGVFRKKQAFFKKYGRFYRKALCAFEHFFVQNEESEKLLSTIGFTNVTVSGDTRFDRTAAILHRDNRLDFIENFLGNETAVVAGSSWPKDETLLTRYIKTNPTAAKWIIAPHNIHINEIQNLKNQLGNDTILYSEKKGKDLSSYRVLIIDTVGLLTKIYSYATVAYVGGGFGNPGVHNVLEPAVFGVPVIIGPNYSHFQEAAELVRLGGCLSISGYNDLEHVLNQLIESPDLRKKKGEISSGFVLKNLGATQTITDYLSKK